MNRAAKQRVQDKKNKQVIDMKERSKEQLSKITTSVLYKSDPCLHKPTQISIQEVFVSSCYKPSTCTYTWYFSLVETFHSQKNYTYSFFFNSYQV